MTVQNSSPLSLSALSRILALSCLCSEVAVAAPVDSEIVILVDGQTFSQTSFDLILNGVAQAFEQQSLIDSVASGPFGTIAASVLVFNGTGASTAIPWMELSSTGDLQNFADSVRSIPRTFSFAVDYANAISAASASIASSVVEGTFSQITIVEDANFVSINNTVAEIQSARDTALASGVDVINSLVYNAGGAARQTLIENFYNDNVVGGGENGQVTVIGGGGFLAPTPTGALASTALDGIAASVSQPTIDSSNFSVIPEPSVSLLGAVSMLALATRRRRASV